MDIACEHSKSWNMVYWGEMYDWKSFQCLLKMSQNIKKLAQPKISGLWHNFKIYVPLPQTLFEVHLQPTIQWDLIYIYSRHNVSTLCFVSASCSCKSPKMCELKGFFGIHRVQGFNKTEPM